MSVLFCDSNCELWHTKIKELNLQVISMPYTIGGVEYYYDNGEKTDFKGFYNKVRAGEMPVTSALNSTNYIEIFQPYFEAGEEILYISFSEKMSATFTFLETAISELSAKYPAAKFTRFDTKSISMGAGLQVFLAATFFKAGHSVAETVEYLKSITDRIGTLFMVDSLNHLKKGGRLSSSAAFFGTLIQIKPVLKISNEGTLSIYSKQKGTLKALRYMVDEMIANYQPIDNCPIVIVDADSEEYSVKLEEMVRKALPDAEIWKQPVGPTVGTHCGPGTCAVLFPSKSR